MHRAALAAAAVASLLIVSVGLAGASQVLVNAGTYSADSKARCATAVLEAEPNGVASGGSYTSVSLSAMPPECNDLPVAITIFDAGFTSLATGSGVTGTLGAVNLTTGSYLDAAATGATVVIDGYGFATNWTAAAPPPPISCKPVNNGGNTTGQACAVAVTSTSHWISYPGAWGVGTPYHHAYISYEVTTGQNRWEVTINFADPSMPGGGFTPTYVGSSYNVITAPGYACTSLPTFVAWKGAGNVGSQNNAVLYYTTSPTSTQGTTQLCP